MDLEQQAQAWLEVLCRRIGERCVGSAGNREAATFFAETVRAYGWRTETQLFEAMDWIGQGASLKAGEAGFEVFSSPYSLGCRVSAPLLPVATLQELEQAALKDKLLLLHGEIAKEQLMPKNFVFYNPAEHQHIIALLEQGGPQAILSATGRNASLAGGVYPFPLIEDGDFHIPSVYMTDVEGSRLLAHAGTTLELESIARRIPGSGWNCIASNGAAGSRRNGAAGSRRNGAAGSRRNGAAGRRRIVISAHIDAKKGTPGAIDNASGVVVLLLLADLLQGAGGSLPVELLALNGEDYYSAPGQMAYLHANHDRFDRIALNINLDGAGYHEGKSAFSFYGLPADLLASVDQVIGQFPGLTTGAQWVQGDHGMFIQNGCPAIAVTSQWFSEHIDDQDITHTSRDNLDIVNAGILVEIAHALAAFLHQVERLDLIHQE